MKEAIVGVMIGLMLIVVVAGLASIVFWPITHELSRMSDLLAKIVKKLE
jgi:hypothetical protein